jgi:serine/threonine protein kinase
MTVCTRCCHTLASLDDKDGLLSQLKLVGPTTVQKDPSAPPAPETPAQSAEIPKELLEHPRYRILAALGSGGMGAVFKAEHRLLERSVVIKVIRPDLVNDPEMLQRFQRESRLAAKLSHPNIVTVYEAEQIGNVHLLVMEYIDGENLLEVLRKRGPLPIEVACELTRQAAVGLQHLHEQRLVHRDIKPANLILAVGGQLKVLDLGLAFLKHNAPRERHMTLPQQSLGTIDYMAPEQWEDAHGVDIRADIYSLGCTLYHLLVGSPPFGISKAPNMMRQIWAHSLAPVPPIREKRCDSDVRNVESGPAGWAQTYRIQNWRLVSLWTMDSLLTPILNSVRLSLCPLVRPNHSEKRPEVPDELAAILDRMLAKDRADRFAVPADVVAALEPLAAGCDAEAARFNSAVIRFR